MNLSYIFRDKQHYVTVRYRDDSHYPKRSRLFKIKQLDKILKNQAAGTDVYITKYPENRVIETLIFDFDSETNIKEAEKDSKKLYNYLTSQGLNVVRVESGSKGYHVYIQITPLSFDFESKDAKHVFELFCENITGRLHVKRNGETGLNLETLDRVNTMAGLGGNIRVIGSTHPKTNNLCKIVQGKFLNMRDDDIANNYYEKAHNFTWECYSKALNRYDTEVKQIEEKRKMKQTNFKSIYGNPIENYDLREVIPSLFTGEVKDYGEYIQFNCFEHNDNHQSLRIKKEFFFCQACGFQGNIWYLIKKELFKPEIKAIKTKRRIMEDKQ